MDEVDAQRIHEASLALLSDPGVKIEHDDVLALLKRHGGREGGDPQSIRMPPGLVRECLEICPSEFALTDLRGQARRLSPTAEPLFWSCPGMNLWRAGACRPFTSQDMAETARLLDRLGNVDVVFGMSMDDVPPGARDVVGLNLMAHNTGKHIRALCFTPDGAETMAAMRDVVGDHAWFSVGFTAHGPLRWTRLALEIFRRTAGKGIPTSVNGEPMAGVSGPVTLAGSAAVGNAEILAGLVINQLLEPGRACIYNLGLAHVFDMRTSVAVTGGPENALYAEVSGAMGRFYQLPSASWVSTESMCPDAQAGLEKMFGFRTHVESGVTTVWGVGQLESEMTFSPAQAVIDNEMIAYARRYARGVETSDEALALSVTREVGAAGSFLAHAHTLEHFRDELYMPRLLWRKRREDWQAEGEKRLEERAEEVAAELMRQPAEPALAQDQLRELDRIVDRFIARP